MRVLVGLLLVFILIISVGIWTNHTLGATTVELIAIFDEIEQNLQREQWDVAQKKFQELVTYWDGKSKWWTVIIDHQEIDNIEFSMARIGAYLEKKSDHLVWGELAELRLMIQHIPEKEAFKIQNIL